MLQVDKQVEELAAYIAVTYGSKQLGLLRLLSTFSYFRESLRRRNFARLLSVPMISFEKALKENCEVNYATTRLNEFIVERGGKRGTFEDDPLRSNSRLIVHQLRGLFPEFSSLQLSPANQVGQGLAISDVFDSLDLVVINKYLSDYKGELSQQHPALDNDVATVIDNTALVTESPFKKYLIVNAMSNILLALRRQPLVDSNVDFCTEDEFVKVLLGIKQKSVPASMLVSPVIRDTLKKVHEGCYEDAEGNVIIGGIPCLIRLLGYPASVEFSWDLLTEDVKGKPFQGAIKKKPQAGQVPLPGKSAPPVHKKKNICVEASEFPYAEEGYNHVVHYAPIDLNSLTKKEQIIALYGSVKGKNAYDLASSVWKKKLIRSIPEGPMLGIEYLVRLTTFIKKSSAFRNLEDRYIVLAAAGRFVSWKNLFTFEEDGEWYKNQLEEVCDSSLEEDDV